MESKGNCIDKFIKRKLDKKLIEILKTRASIRRRKNERTNIIDYFDSLLYELDFADIRKLRDASVSLTNECNKFLERISEQYSKLS